MCLIVLTHSMAAEKKWKRCLPINANANIGSWQIFVQKIKIRLWTVAVCSTLCYKMPSLHSWNQANEKPYDTRMLLTAIQNGTAVPVIWEYTYEIVSDEHTLLYEIAFYIALYRWNFPWSNTFSDQWIFKTRISNFFADLKKFQYIFWPKIIFHFIYNYNFVSRLLENENLSREFVKNFRRVHLSCTVSMCGKFHLQILNGSCINRFGIGCGAIWWNKMF